MHDHPRRDQAIAAALAALAGYVDAIGFIASGGLFISFMSGNSTRLGIGLAQASQFAALAGSLLAAFVAGVTLATLIGRRLDGKRRRGQLLLVAALLGGGFTLGQIGFTWPALLLAAMAMGAENCVFEAGGDVRISLTFMTGNLVKIGQRLALALSGGHTAQLEGIGDVGRDVHVRVQTVVLKHHRHVAVLRAQFVDTLTVERNLPG